MPSNCPSCNSILESVNDLLFCKNNNCSTKSAKKIQHFAKTLYIKGLGPRSIEKLGLSSVVELYYLDEVSASLAINSVKSRGNPKVSYNLNTSLPLIMSPVDNVFVIFYKHH